jgi:hypothetical protein
MCILFEPCLPFFLKSPSEVSPNQRESLSNSEIVSKIQFGSFSKLVKKNQKKEKEKNQKKRKRPSGANPAQLPKQPAAHPGVHPKPLRQPLFPLADRLAPRVRT